MGSDSIRKSTHYRHYVYRFTNASISSRTTLLLVCTVCLLLLVFLTRILLHVDNNNKNAKEEARERAKLNILTSKLRRKESSYAKSNNRIISSWEIQSTKTELPSQCLDLLGHFNKCQSSKETIVFGCHRKWCSSWYGHCEEVNGIGDRTQRMLSMVTDALDKCVRIEFDYPQTRNGIDLRFPSSFEYRDPWGILAEIFHFRSYDVSNQDGIDVESWGTFRNSSVVHTSFVHFTPRGYQWHPHYNPCLYHILFKTTNKFQTEISYYEDLFKLKEGNAIGIHFRTGDLTAFGVDNKDIRAPAGSSLQSSYEKMVSCAETLAINLNLQRHGSTNTGDKFRFFLATDNEHVKEMAKHDERYEIFMIHEKPSPYLVSDGDRTAYLDLYLLSKTAGLTVNVLPHEYNGPAERVSTFAKLSWNIGFMTRDQLYECEIE